MTIFDDVINLFLSLVTEYGYIDYSEEDLREELGLKVKMVIPKTRVVKDLQFNDETYEFSREITEFEKLILAKGLVVEWVSPKVHNVELFKAQLSSKDFTTFSNANRLNSLMELRNNAIIEFNSLINDYDYDITDLFDGDDK